MQTSSIKKAGYALLPALLFAFLPASAQQTDTIPLKQAAMVQAIEIDHGGSTVQLHGKPITDSSLKPISALTAGEPLKNYNIVVDYNTNRIYVRPAVSIYTGRYLLADKAVVTIRLEKGQLWGKKQNGNEVLLEPTGPDRFILTELQLNLEFSRDAGGKVRRLKIFSGERSLEGEKEPD